MKNFLLIFSIFFIGLTNAQTDTTSQSGDYFLTFVKKVYLNPTVYLRCQQFKESTNIGFVALPDLSSSQNNASTGFEKGLQKLLRLLMQTDGGIRFYFNPDNPTAPFTFWNTDNLWCKFKQPEKDSINYYLNHNFSDGNLDLNNNQRFEYTIDETLDYIQRVLATNTAECGSEPQNETTSINTKPLAINLHNTSGSKYDIDHKQYEELASNYASATDVFTQQEWYAPSKMFVTGNGTEPVVMSINLHDPQFKKENLKIEILKTHTVLQFTYSNDSVRFNLPDNLVPSDPVEVLVKYKSLVDSVEYTVGFFMINVVAEQQQKLVLLGANGYVISNTDISNVQSYLNKIYKPVGIDFEVSSNSYIFPNDFPTTIEDVGSGLLSNYPPDLQDYVSDVKDLNDYDGDTYYLVLGLHNSNTDLLGYMPRARNIGFIYSEQGSTLYLPSTVAHEIGHGTFHFRHIFDDEELGENYHGGTHNIMDYSDVELQNALYVHQWNYIQDPSFVSWTDGDDEDADAIYNQSVTLFKPKEDSYYTVTQLSTNVQGFYTPSGYAVSFGDVEAANWVLSDIKIDEYSGGVSGFTLNNIEYTGLYEFNNVGNYTFHFYMKSDAFEAARLAYRQYQIDHEEEPSETSIKSWYLTRYVNDHQNSIPNLRPSYPNENLIIQFFEKGCSSFLCISKRVTLTSAKNPVATWKNSKFSSPLNGERTPFYLETINTEWLNISDLFAQKGIMLQETQTMNQLMCDYVAILARKKYGSRFLEKFNFNENFQQELGIGFNSSGVVDTVKARSYINIAKAYDALDSNIISKIGSPQLRERLKNILDYKFAQNGQQLSSLEQTELYFQLLLKVQREVKDHLDSISNTKDEDYITYVVTNLLDDNDLKLLSLQDRIGMVQCLVSDWMWHDEEMAALRILNTAADNQSTDILTELIKKRTIYDAAGVPFYNNIFTALYKRVTGAENKEYIVVLFKLWHNSDYYRTDRPEYDYTGKPMVFDYKSEQVLGFYDSNYNLELIGDFYQIKITREIPSVVMNQPYIPALVGIGIDIYNSVANEEESYYYHPFQPIGLVNINDLDGEDIQLPSERLPAFLFYGFDDINTSQNIRFATEIAIDVLTTVLGVPPFLSAISEGVTAFRQLSRMRKFILGVKVVEFTAGATNIILKYACDEQNTTCQNVQSFLTAVEVACLSGDAIFGVIAKQKAKKLLSESLEEVRQMDNADEIEEILRKTADDFAGAGLDFQKYLKKAIAADASLSAKIAGVTFKSGDEFLDIIIHADAAGNFFIKAEGSAQKALSKQELANIMNATPANKKIRLLSCNDEAAAKELSTMVNRPFYASDGWVDVYPGGQVYSKNKFYKYNNGNKSADDFLPHNSNAPDGLGAKIRMGVSKPETLPSLTPNPNAIPGGNPSPVLSQMDDATRTSIIRENDGASVLAKKGFNIEQNPVVSGTTRKPDYMIEGNVFDCYSPYNPNKSVRGIWDEVTDKVVTKQQTKRVFIHLRDWNGNIADLQNQFDNFPIEGLEEIMILNKNNEIIHLNL